MTFETFFYGKEFSERFREKYNILEDILISMKINNEIIYLRREKNSKNDYILGKILAIDFLINNKFTKIADKISEESMNVFINENTKLFGNEVFLNKFKKTYNIIDVELLVYGATSVFNDIYKLMFSDKYTEVIRDLKENSETLKNFLFDIFNNDIFKEYED